jgi:hypothetical protein
MVNTVPSAGCEPTWAPRLSGRALPEKGWTPAKIARALQSARLSSARHAGGAHAATLAAVLRELCTRQPVFLFFRTISGARAQDRQHVTGRLRLPRDAYAAGSGVVPADTIVELVAPDGR